MLRKWEYSIDHKVLRVDKVVAYKIYAGFYIVFINHNAYEKGYIKVEKWNFRSICSFKVYSTNHLN